MALSARGILKRFAKVAAYGLAAYLAVCVVLLVVYRFVYPPITTVQIQRSVEAVIGDEELRFEYHPVRPFEIAVDLKLATVVAEDARFFHHYGIDWAVVEKIVAEGSSRGGSTITQQLVKNLFMTTHRSFVRKALEVPLAYAAELILPKKRILDLYLNVIEWGPGIYGVEAGSQYHFGKSAADLSKIQAAGLAACIPAPRTRMPATSGWYTRQIITRMRQADPHTRQQFIPLASRR